jgi:hypothetical protein
MSTHIPANCLTFMQKQILSHKTLVEEHQKIYKALRTLVVSTSDAYIISPTDLWLMKIMDMVNNASALNESLLNALTTRVDTSKRVNKTSSNG